MHLAADASRFLPARGARQACAALVDTAALKDRATRRLGEIMEAQRNTVGLAKGRGSETRVI